MKCERCPTITPSPEWVEPAYGAEGEGYVACPECAKRAVRLKWGVWILVKGQRGELEPHHGRWYDGEVAKLDDTVEAALEFRQIGETEALVLMGA